MVVAPTWGSPSRRTVRSNVLSDQVAVPSTCRSGARWAVATIRARATASYVGRRPRPPAIRSAPSPSRLNRRTRLLTVVPLRNPASRAAASNACPRATANTAVARRTRSRRSLLAFAIVANSPCSASVSGRKRSFCMGPMTRCSYHAVSPHRPLPHTNAVRPTSGSSRLIYVMDVEGLCWPSASSADQGSPRCESSMSFG